MKRNALKLCLLTRGVKIFRKRPKSCLYLSFKTNSNYPLLNYLYCISVPALFCNIHFIWQQLARIHGDVVAIDPSDELIKTACNHLQSHSHQELSNRIKYYNETIEEHISRTETKYDAVVVSEVLEHVDDKESFLKSCTAPLLPGGSIFITTLNKTNFSWIGGIVFAEYILNVIPKGTHDWNKFISPLETQRLLEQCLYYQYFDSNRTNEMNNT